MTPAKIAAVVLLALKFAGSLVRAQENADAAAREIVEDEGKFYQMGQEQGTRAAFLAFLSDDSIVFQPGPINGKEAWTKRPEKGISLKWRPLVAGMSRSADLGYTTGPAEWKREKEDEKPFGYGQFVSIWRKQKDGGWKVALDVGSELPGPAKAEESEQVELHMSESPPPATTEKTPALRLLRNAEGKFASVARTDSTAAILGSGSGSLRVHREGVFPAVGKDAAGLMLSVRRGELMVDKLGSGMSEAGDLAYTYGKYSLVRSEKTERGHYLQIWQLESDGTWKIALDYQAPLPPEQKK